MRHIWPIVILASALLAATCDTVSSLPGPDGGSLPAAPSISTAEATSAQELSLVPDDYIFPLKVTANKRYLVDQNSKPFLMVGDAPQTIVANLSLAEASAYMANRREYGINALWINLLCNFSDGCNKDATTFDGVAPFLATGDISKPNPVYFQRTDDIVKLAAANGMVVLLDPIETSSWLPILRAAGAEQAFRYGQYLGRRYKDFPNIIWMHGNDFQSWRDRTDDALVQAVARGIRSEDSMHIQTIELNYLTSGSLDDPSWAPLIELDAAYTYYPTYAQVLTEYNRADFKPVFMVEANYEFERWQEGSPQALRRQEYWTMLSGATGQIYGNYFTWRLEKGWQDKIDTPGAKQLRIMKNLFSIRKWYDLVPDQDHVVVIDGYGILAEYIGKLTAYVGNLQLPFDLVARLKRRTGLGLVRTNMYASAARTSDGTLAMVYLPSARTITVDMSKLAGPVVARWYDPTSGNFRAIGDSPFTNMNGRRFNPPNSNAGGDGDWVLVLETDPPRDD
jgi:Protein of unknown function (DUF4038)/Putative collagen-binding domain of a collagenase